MTAGVAITGLGIVSPLGVTVNEFSRALRSGVSAIRPLGDAFGDLRAVPAARVPEFLERDEYESKQWRAMDRVSQFAVKAAQVAASDAQLEFNGVLGSRTAVVLGSATGGQTTVDAAYARLYRDGGRVPPATIPRWMINAPAGNVSIDLAITGPSFCVASACASTTQAIGLAYSMVSSGAVDVAITGGTDASLSYGAIKCWEAMRIMSPDQCRPFSLNRRGLTLGEGSAIFILESISHARARNAQIHARIVGFGASSDAVNLAAPTPEGAASAIAACLTDGGLVPQDIDYVNAHGTGTYANDLNETRALHIAMGRHASKLAISSTKAAHGHALGAAGGLELMATIVAMRDGFIPPTLGFDGPDPDCDLDYVPDIARSGAIAFALSNSFAFGGHNAVLALAAGV